MEIGKNKISLNPTLQQDDAILSAARYGLRTKSWAQTITADEKKFAAKIDAARMGGFDEIITISAIEADVVIAGIGANTDFMNGQEGKLTDTFSIVAEQAVPEIQCFADTAGILTKQNTCYN